MHMYGERMEGHCFCTATRSASIICHASHPLFATGLYVAPLQMRYRPSMKRRAFTTIMSSISCKIDLVYFATPCGMDVSQVIKRELDLLRYTRIINTAYTVLTMQTYGHNCYESVRRLLGGLSKNGSAAIRDN